MSVVVSTYLGGEALIQTLKSVTELDYPKERIHVQVVSGEVDAAAEQAT